ncbi:MAG: hypothetical protein ACOCG5_02340 [Candidatus Alkaliphilus sp. MAG34]|nr:hypothetical protein [Clostridiales bacterium]
MNIKFARPKEVYKFAMFDCKYCQSQNDIKLKSRMTFFTQPAVPAVSLYHQHFYLYLYRTLLSGNNKARDAISLYQYIVLGGEFNVAKEK